jgi:hypothetical protein
MVALVLFLILMICILLREIIERPCVDGLSSKPPLIFYADEALKISFGRLEDYPYIGLPLREHPKNQFKKYWDEPMRRP